MSPMHSAEGSQTTVCRPILATRGGRCAGGAGPTRTSGTEGQLAAKASKAWAEGGCRDIGLPLPDTPMLYIAPPMHCIIR